MSSNKIFTFLMNHHSGKAEIQKLMARHLFKCFKIKKREGRKKGNNIYIELVWKTAMYQWYKTQKKILSPLVFYCNVCLYAVRYGSVGLCTPMYALNCYVRLCTAVKSHVLTQCSDPSCSKGE